MLTNWRARWRNGPTITSSASRGNKSRLPNQASMNLMMISASRTMTFSTNNSWWGKDSTVLRGWNWRWRDRSLRWIWIPRASPWWIPLSRAWSMRIKAWSAFSRRTTTTLWTVRSDRVLNCRGKWQRTVSPRGSSQAYTPPASLTKNVPITKLTTGTLTESPNMDALSQRTCSRKSMGLSRLCTSKTIWINWKLWRSRKTWIQKPIGMTEDTYFTLQLNHPSIDKLSMPMLPSSSMTWNSNRRAEILLVKKAPLWPSPAGKQRKKCHIFSKCKIFLHSTE